MHELSICIALMETVQRIAAERNATRVSKIVLGIGPLSGVEPDLLRNAYPLAAAGTIAANANVVIETDEVIVSCSQCGSESTVLSNRLLCGRCGDFRTRVVQGDEMILKSLELEKGALREASGAHARDPTELLQ